MKKIVVFTGAGVSADSGLTTFPDAEGMPELVKKLQSEATYN